jgi:early secretory antigenic target protein ESAT-6
VSSDLKSSIGAVDSDAGELTSRLQGPAGASAQAAFARFQEAATKQINQLNDIGGDVARAGVQYEPPAGGSGALVTGDPALVINGQIATIQVSSIQGGQAVRKLAAVWGGSGSDAYQVVQQRWDASADELNAALQDLSTKISDAGSATQ